MSESEPTLNHLMSMLSAKEIDDLTAEDIDSLIAIYREQRKAYEGGAKPKKDTGPKVKVDLAALGLAPKPTPANTIRRRV